MSWVGGDSAWAEPPTPASDARTALHVAVAPAWSPVGARARLSQAATSFSAHSSRAEATVSSDTVEDGVPTAAAGDDRGVAGAELPDGSWACRSVGASAAARSLARSESTWDLKISSSRTAVTLALSVASPMWRLSHCRSTCLRMSCRRCLHAEAERVGVHRSSPRAPDHTTFSSWMSSASVQSRRPDSDLCLRPRRSCSASSP